MTSRSVLIALFVSIGLNLFLVGGLVGGLVVGARFKAAAAAPRAPLVRAADSLPPQQRQAYRQALREEARSVFGDLREARQARQEAWRGLEREPLDQAQVIADLDRARARELAARGAIEHRIVSFAAGLSPRERAELAEGLMRAGPRGRGRHGPPPPSGPAEPPPGESR